MKTSWKDHKRILKGETPYLPNGNQPWYGGILGAAPLLIGMGLLVLFFIIGTKLGMKP